MRRNRRTGQPIVPTYRISGDSSLASTHLPAAREYLMKANRIFGQHTSFSTSTVLQDGTAIKAVKAGRQFLLFVDAPPVIPAIQVLPDPVFTFIVSPAFNPETLLASITEYDFVETGPFTGLWDMTAVTSDLKGSGGYKDILNEPVDHVEPIPDTNPTEFRDVRLGHNDSERYGNVLTIEETFLLSTGTYQYPTDILLGTDQNEDFYNRVYGSLYQQGTLNRRDLGSITYDYSGGLSTTPEIFPASRSFKEDALVGEIDWKGDSGVLLTYHGPSSRGIPEGYPTSTHRPFVEAHVESNSTPLNMITRGFHTSTVIEGDLFFDSLKSKVYLSGAVLFDTGSNRVVAAAATGSIPNPNPNLPAEAYYIFLISSLGILKSDDFNPNDPSVPYSVGIFLISDREPHQVLSESDLTFLNISNTSGQISLAPDVTPAVFSGSGLKAAWISQSGLSEHEHLHQVMLTRLEIVDLETVTVTTEVFDKLITADVEEVYTPGSPGGQRVSASSLEETTITYPLSIDYIDGGEEEIILYKEEKLSFSEQIISKYNHIFGTYAVTNDSTGDVTLAGIYGLLITTETDYDLTSRYYLSTGLGISRAQVAIDKLSEEGWKVHATSPNTQGEVTLFSSEYSFLFDEDNNFGHAYGLTHIGDIDLIGDPNVFQGFAVILKTLGQFETSAPDYLEFVVETLDLYKNPLVDYPLNYSRYPSQASVNRSLRVSAVAVDLRKSLVAFSHSFFEAQVAEDPTLPYEVITPHQGFLTIPGYLHYEIEIDKVEPHVDGISPPSFQTYTAGTVASVFQVKKFNENEILSGFSRPSSTFDLNSFLAPDPTIEGDYLPSNLGDQPATAIRTAAYSGVRDLGQDQSLLVTREGVLSYTLLSVKDDFLFLSPFVDHIPGFKEPYRISQDPEEPTREHVSNLASALEIPDFIGENPSSTGDNLEGYFLNYSVFKGILSR